MHEVSLAYTLAVWQPQTYAENVHGAQEQSYARSMVMAVRTRCWSACPETKEKPDAISQ